MKLLHHRLVDDRGSIDEAVLEDGSTSVSILSIGCVTRDWRVAHGGQTIPVVLGYANPLDYVANPNSLGIIAGRVANRTALGRAVIDGVAYQLSINRPPHHLHGGPTGLSRRMWRMETDSAASAVRLTYRSPDGEEGYPGTVDFAVTIRLEGQRLTYEMTAAPDRPTPINLAQHSYYNLMGAGSVHGHRLRLAARHYTETDADLIPTGAILPVDGTPLDYRNWRAMVEADPAETGVDTNLVLNADRDPAQPVAEVEAPNGLGLKLWTDQPGLQLYDTKHLGRLEGGLDGKVYGRFGGLCLEPQHFPDSLNQPAFPSIVYSPERPYLQTLGVEIAPVGQS